MNRVISFLAFLCLGPVATFAGDPAASIAAIKKGHPPKPEANGLRLEVNADLDDVMGGKRGDDYAWEMAFRTIEVALHNVSDQSVTVPTTAWNEQPQVTTWDDVLTRIIFSIGPAEFHGKPTAFVAARFTPVVLAPGETVLLLKHTTPIRDRHEADMIKEASVSFVVSSRFDGPTEWWRGALETYVPIRRHFDPDEESARMKVSFKRYAAQKKAEEDPAYGAANAGHVAALIASADQVRIRGEGEPAENGTIIRDPAWIQRVSAAVAATTLPHSASCMCTGWRTAHFQKNGEDVVSVAAIHGSQLRIYWKEGEGGDYRIPEADWKAVEAALQPPATAGVVAPTPVPPH